jgi:hypothetical protein
MPFQTSSKLDFIQILQRPPEASSRVQVFYLDFSVYEGNAATFEKSKRLSVI